MISWSSTDQVSGRMLMGGCWLMSESENFRAIYTGEIQEKSISKASLSTHLQGNRMRQKAYKGWKKLAAEWRETRRIGAQKEKVGKSVRKSSAGTFHNRPRKWLKNPAQRPFPNFIPASGTALLIPASCTTHHTRAPSPLSLLSSVGKEMSVFSLWRRSFLETP